MSVPTFEGSTTLEELAENSSRAMICLLRTLERSQTGCVFRGQDTLEDISDRFDLHLPTLLEDLHQSCAGGFMVTPSMKPPDFF